MRYYVLILLFFILITLSAKVQASASVTIQTLTSSSSSNSSTCSLLNPNCQYPLQSTILLTATTSGKTPYVTFYYQQGGNTIILGTVSPSDSTGTTFIYSWTPPPALTGTFSVYAAASNGVALGSTSLYGPIDLVGDTTLFPNANLANNSIFGEGGSGSWLPGDNQMCSASWPYNGDLSAPNGMCEWTGTAAASPLSVTANSTVDSLDDVMHTFSDFVTFSNSILNSDAGTINTTFDNWYPFAAQWIAPACTGADQCSTDTSVLGDPLSLTPPACPNVSCNPGDNDGRLLSIYEPAGYPNISGWAYNNKKPAVDKLNDWNNAVTTWLNTSYTPSTATSSTAVWCVPLESAISGSAEDTYIQQNAPTSVWGDLPHVIACLNYNAGPTTAQQATSNYQNYLSCLNYLQSGACPTVISGTPCDAGVLGASSPVWDSSDPNRCNVFSKGSFANAVNNQINFGPVNNYKNCLSLVTNQCPASLANTVCDPSVLGRSLTSGYTGCADGSSCSGGKCSTSGAKCVVAYSGGAGSSSCNPVASVSDQYPYSKWLEDNITLFTDETPKFSLRSAFLTDIFTRAQTMQNITAQADIALHNFLKPCGSADCSDGGPAAQLIYRHTQVQNSTTALPKALPNAVVYGWVDSTLPNGQTLPGRPAGAGGYAHIVKVTAFSTGRNGKNGEGGVAIQSQMPWIYTWTSGTFGTKRNFELMSRDGAVFVSVKRWDEEHSSAVTFPNGNTLWQFLYHNPNALKNINIATPFSLFGAVGGCAINYGASGIFGFGLMAQTAQGLAASNIVPQDKTSLQYAFMLNDSGDGTVDTTNGASSSSCIQAADALLSTGTESHACAEYIASSNASKSSGTGDTDYSIKFVDCSTLYGSTLPDAEP
ncbi:MAG: hypothetical protein HQL12_04995 [Candidatus Omnitrophica bacterium]|nr:hypothetical protein [Candidatus Omnitrophota bacterium]